MSESDDAYRIAFDRRAGALLEALEEIRDLAYAEVIAERSGDRMADLCARKVFTIANEILARP